MFIFSERLRTLAENLAILNYEIHSHPFSFDNVHIERTR